MELILKEQKDALLLPSESILVGQKGHYVYVVGANSTAQIAPVVVGQRYGQMSSVLKGITAKDRVITQGQLNLYPGVKVQVKQPQEEG